MASPSTMCTACLRAARRVATRSTKSAFAGSAAHASSSTSARDSPHAIRTVARTYTYTHGPARPHLDFLAPSTLLPANRASAFNNSLRLPRRTLTTSTSASTSPTPTPSASPPAPTPSPSSPTPARAILNPRTDSTGTPLTLSISPRASTRLHSIATRDHAPDTALRISIESGGCHGFQYLMSLTDLAKEPAEPEDTVFEGTRGEKVVVDEASLELLSGSTVDYTMELIGSQFKVTGIPGATSSCGCGTSFDIKMD